jgi:hypothetical protein
MNYFIAGVRTQRACVRAFVVLFCIQEIEIS